VRWPFGVRGPDRSHPLVAGSIEANAVPTAYITHPSFLLHDMGPHHPECPDRLSAINDRLISAGLDPYLRHYSAPAATAEQLGRVHSRDYIALIEAEAPTDGLHFLDPDTAMNAHSLGAARRAAGAVVLATELVLSGECRNAFCAVRPPGHHAERDRAMGFCLFNNVAVGAAHALAQGLERVAIVDFDVHHGNGTEVMFTDDPRVLMISTFQHPLYPYSGLDNTAPNMVNIPLAAGTGGKGFRDAVNSFRYDPRLAGLLLAYVTTATFYAITEAGFRMLSPSWIFLLLAAVTASGLSRGVLRGKKPGVLVAQAEKIPATLDDRQILRHQPSENAPMQVKTDRTAAQANSM